MNDYIYNYVCFCTYHWRLLFFFNQALYFFPISGKALLTSSKDLVGSSAAITSGWLAIQLTIWVLSSSLKVLPKDVFPKVLLIWLWSAGSPFTISDIFLSANCSNSGDLSWPASTFALISGSFRSLLLIYSYNPLWAFVGVCSTWWSLWIRVHSAIRNALRTRRTKVTFIISL